MGEGNFVVLQNDTRCTLLDADSDVDERLRTLSLVESPVEEAISGSARGLRERLSLLLMPDFEKPVQHLLSLNSIYLYTRSGGIGLLCGNNNGNATTTLLCSPTNPSVLALRDDGDVDNNLSILFQIFVGGLDYSAPAFSVNITLIVLITSAIVCWWTRLR